MAILKCKMCGGDLNIEPGMTVCECEYCSTKQTVPTLDNEKKTTLFTRANRLRSMCEFDKAYGVYESIVAEFPEESEAYWGLILCKYGIEYVDDPATAKKIPTCHRSSFESLMDDPNYEMTLEYSDSLSRTVYREEAKQIEELRKGIIEISGKEEPYDIFICYKETAENGERTIDSVIAQDVYKELTNEGYRVFFSRITLEDKLGREYEPYIFAALHSAKVMLAFGTDYEYFNAVWVKNEWSRYLQLISQGEKKTLIPCYKGIDAYDMPKEFARLQAQDMGKVGATQDLLRGIEKILGSKKQEVVKETVVVQSGNTTNVDAMIKRGNLALEDKEWGKADGFFEDALNQNPECADAYLGKLLTFNKVDSLDNYFSKLESKYSSTRSEKLYACAEETEHINLVVKENVLEGYLEANAIKDLYNFDISYTSALSCRKEQKSKQQNEIESDKLLTRVRQYAAGELKEQIESGLEKLISIHDSRIAEEEKADEAKKAEITTNYEAHIEEADKKAFELRQKADEEKYKHYKSIVTIMKTASTISAYERARDGFKALGVYEDSFELAKECQSEINRIQSQIDRIKEEERLEKERVTRKTIKIAAVTIGAIVAIIAAILIVVKVVIPTNKYNKAIDLKNNGQYSEAVVAFDLLNGYKDSDAQIINCQTALKDIDYKSAFELMNNGQYSEAISVFENLDGYKDSNNQILECKYNLAVSYMNNGQYSEAISVFENLDGYKDSNNQILEYKYNLAVSYMNNGQYSEAIAAFEELDGYKDSNEQVYSIKSSVGYISTLSIGDSFYFGSYKNELLEWTILAIQDNQVFAITTNPIDKKPYNNKRTDVTWSTCSLRTWLNKDFINAAFNSEEQSRIMTTTVNPGNNPEFSTNAGNATEDKIFLLSFDEVKRYFISDESRKCEYDGDACWWWLRSPGRSQDYAAYVLLGGSVYYDGHPVDYALLAVRPAMWINLES